MPVTYKIFHDPILVFIRYFGHVTLPDIAQALKQFSKEGANYQGQPHFFDFSRVTSYDVDYNEFFKLIGHLADAYPQSTGEHLFVFFAPDGPPADLSAILRVPYAQSPTLLVRIARTPEQAFDILGNERPEVLAQLNIDA
ncbi:hypothetical protein L0664_17010 [Octadecabacter sp. G9-8]|uniref:Barstar (barnase inhibitor) domain-containing protein n=1 Tax=Octadecabacter dasysiphoniae TaxID=2909341 RepID=A0ABS9CZR4_9RHOB|nr:hypothetical protein [Octadecabacter dasysiphoniae]MCF2872770.1 hypothetical protein [Octadecabacter dasysiphoniae]